MILFLFGFPCAGKTYIGHLLETQHSFYFYDADGDLTPAMQCAIQQRTIFTPEMRDEYFACVLAKLQQLTRQYPNVAISQGFAKEVHRKLFQQYFPAAHWFYITADRSTREKRILERGDWVTLEYARRIEAVYESPLHPHVIIDNSQNQDLTEQLNHFFNSL